ncbi:small ribosomal subunit protein eS10-like [Watersipora subatra]|uniref:small ribosomal subunit protein eS10-like n=1 Tax=Watersipora subatra TaxID=2589382 RepID=UPI00355C991A
MLMPKKNRVAIYEALFKDGVLVAEKKLSMDKHPDIEVPNLHVVKAMMSLKSRGYVKEQFAWRHYYWYLTNDGIEYLREFLHLPAEIVPSTLKRQQRADTARPRGRETQSRPMDGSDRRDYRRGPPGSDKKADSGAGATTAGDIQFRGGFGGGFGRGSKPPGSEE